MKDCEELGKNATKLKSCNLKPERQVKFPFPRLQRNIAAPNLRPKQVK